jgi:hypothetical protein
MLEHRETLSAFALSLSLSFPSDRLWRVAIVARIGDSTTQPSPNLVELSSEDRIVFVCLNESVSKHQWRSTTTLGVFHVAET